MLSFASSTLDFIPEYQVVILTESDSDSGF